MISCRDMDRAIGIVLVVLFAALVLPTVAALAQAVVPLLVVVLILLFGLRLLLPTRRH
jgi:hypothetical protein